MAEVAPARPASTVVLLRDRPGGPEAYLLRRVTGMAFAGGMTVFPGGRVDPADGAGQAPWAGPVPPEWADRLSADESLVRALVCAAVRETFEESGVLLAGPAAGQVVADVSGAEWEAERRALEARDLTLSEVLSRRGLLVCSDLLRPWTHWITPESEPRRYDTRFFVAALPAGQATRDVGGEADRVSWMRPADAVAAHQRGDLPMLPPTAVTLEELSGYDSTAAVLDAADRREITPILPRIFGDGGPLRVVLPGQEGYGS
ncbi:MAG: NUDIX hydrolase [Mycobacteriales bacterium]